MGLAERWKRAVDAFEKAEARLAEDSSDAAGEVYAALESMVINTPAPDVAAVAYKLFLFGRVLAPDIGEDFDVAKAKEWAAGAHDYSQEVVGNAYLDLLRLLGRDA